MIFPFPKVGYVSFLEGTEPPLCFFPRILEALPKNEGPRKYFFEAGKFQSVFPRDLSRVVATQIFLEFSPRSLGK